MRDVWIAVGGGIFSALVIFTFGRILLVPRLRFSAQVSERINDISPTKADWVIKYQNNSFYRDITKLDLAAVIVIPTYPSALYRKLDGTSRPTDGSVGIDPHARTLAVRVNLPITNNTALRLAPRSSRIASIRIDSPDDVSLGLLDKHRSRIDADILRRKSRIPQLAGDDQASEEQAITQLAAVLEDLDSFLKIPVEERGLRGWLSLRLDPRSRPGWQDEETGRRGPYLVVTANCADSVTGRDYSRSSPLYDAESVRCQPFAGRDDGVIAKALRATMTSAARAYAHQRAHFRLIGMRNLDD